MSGEGVFKFSNNDIYKGNFLFGRADGYGVFKCANGDIHDGLW